MTPKLMLRDGFKDLSISHSCIACGTKKEGRWLYEIVTDTDRSRDTIVSGLKLWDVALESISSAKGLAERLVGKTVQVKEGRIVVPQEIDEIWAENGKRGI